ncbi:uncharacterized protein [Parasteatoda tepidariorum]|uniref:uncharacterized protein isoform X1 n=1 Tax=Parasteatoda tepidariorum TaxID=114398 RepID=UPI001C72346C|nr:uncharacterized protein LOC107438860 isoform X1 [Parasteatoda tepidariorum]
MLYNELKRSRSLETLKNVFNIYESSSRKLVWSEWGKSPFLDYLNLIDYEYKKLSSHRIPWFHITFSESEIHHYCSLAIYEHYKVVVLNDISQSDRDDLPILVQKILRVWRLSHLTYNADESSYLYYYIAYKLLEKGCDDPTLFLELWQTLCVQNKSKIAVLSGVIGKNRKLKAAELLKCVMRAAHALHFDFWGAWTDGHELTDFKYCPVTAALLTGCLEQLTILLQYGFKPNSQRLCTYDNHFKTWRDYVYEWLRVPLAEESSRRRKTVTEVLLFLVNVARCRSRTKFTSMSKCIVLLWSVLPTPIVTLQELKTEINQHLRQPPTSSFYPSTEKNFMELCDFYALLFFKENVTTLQPRSLKHLTKCAIKSHLQKSWNLPFGITSLNLPKSLTSYLQVEMIDL